MAANPAFEGKLKGGDAWLSQISGADRLRVPRLCQSVGTSRVDEASGAVVALNRAGEATSGGALKADPLRTKLRLDRIGASVEPGHLSSCFRKACRHAGVASTRLDGALGAA
jgi:hypothetical protein